jgi:phospholipase C
MNTKRMQDLLVLLVLGLLGARPAYAGSFNTPIQHVIVIVQENRTPDNLFWSRYRADSRGRSYRSLRQLSWQEHHTHALAAGRLL